MQSLKTPLRVLVRTLCSLATATPHKDRHASAHKNVVEFAPQYTVSHCVRTRTPCFPSCSHPNTLSIGSFATEHLVQCRVVATKHLVVEKIRRLFELEGSVVVSPPVHLFASHAHFPASRSKESVINCKSHFNSCFIDVEAAAAAAGSRVPRMINCSCWFGISTMFMFVPSSKAIVSRFCGW